MLLTDFRVAGKKRGVSLVFSESPQKQSLISRYLTSTCKRNELSTADVFLTFPDFHFTGKSPSSLVNSKKTLRESSGPILRLLANTPAPRRT